MGTKAAEKNRRNGFVDVLRLLFAFFVMMHHFHQADPGYFIGGLYGVEFFVVLSGALFFGKWKKLESGGGYKEKLTFSQNYLWNRYKRFFIYNLVAFIPVFILVRIVQQGRHTLPAISSALSSDIWEILMVKMTAGFNGGKSLLNTAAWTMGGMLFAEFVILGMLVWCEKPFLTLIMPLSVLIGTGYWMNIEDTGHAVWLGLFTVGTLRAYLLTCFGIFCYWLCQWIKKNSFSTAGRWGLTVLELLGYLWCILAVFYFKNRYYQFCFLLVVTAALAISLSGRSNTSRWIPQSRFTDFCAEWSLALYLNHILVRRWYWYTYPDVGDILWQHRYVSAAAALAISLIYLFVMRGLFRLLPRIGARAKAVFLR